MMDSEFAGTLRIKLTPAQQDLLKACLVLEQRAGAVPAAVRITDIADLLGTRLPTVTRGVARLRRMGLLKQQPRGPVHLTGNGRALAGQLRHRHADVLRLLTEVLGVRRQLAASEACLLEHGMSGGTAQRLHDFLLQWDSLPAAQRELMSGAAGPRRAPDFALIGRGCGARRKK
jgi:Mn-dependent DtxR family transcriptional regulator